MLDLFKGTSGNIYFFLPNLKYGGAEKTLILVANHCAEIGRKTYLIVANSEGELKQDVSGKVQIIDLKKSKVSECLIPLLRIVRNETPGLDFVTTMYHCNIMACLLKLFIPALNLIIRESTSFDFYKSHFGRAKFTVFRILCSLFYPLANKVVFPSSEMKDKFLAVIPIAENKAYILPNPIDTKLIDQLKAEAISPQQWRPTAACVFINVGRIDRNKNQQMIIHALSLLDPDLDWEFVQVGDGPELGPLKKLADELNLNSKITFVGYQQNPFKFLAKAKVFILSSLCEGYPNVLAQAKYLGLHIISTNCPTGPKEILQDYDQGKLIGFTPEELRDELQAHLRPI